MLSLNSLFLLIQSLSKSEKRYFKLSASNQQGETGYMRLFDFLDCTFSFEDAEKEKLSMLFQGTTVEPARKHLYKTLMKSLRQYEAEKNIEIQLMNLMADSRILFNRSLVDDAFELMGKMKDMALLHEKFLFYILAARQELRMMIRLNFSGLAETALIEKQEKINEIFSHENTLHQHSSLYELLLLRYWKNGEVRSQLEITRLNDLLLEEHYLLNIQTIKNFESQQLHLNFQSVYFLMVGDASESLKVFRELDTLFLENAYLWIDNSVYYVHLLSGILNTLRRMEKYDEMDYFLNRLKEVTDTSKTVALAIEYQVFEYELHSAVNQCNYKLGLELVNRRGETLIREVSQLQIHAQTQVWLSLTRLWYGLGDFSTALRLINRVLNQPSNSFNRMLFVSCRLMNLLIHAALGDTEYLSYEIRSIERKFKTEQNLFRVEKLVIKTLKSWLKNKPAIDIKAEIRMLVNDPFEQQIILELGLNETNNYLNIPGGSLRNFKYFKERI